MTAQMAGEQFLAPITHLMEQSVEYRPFSLRRTLFVEARPESRHEETRAQDN